jgi:type IV pilus assembly protein PilX
MNSLKKLFMQSSRMATRRKSHGISLVIVMLFLVVLSLLGISAIQTSTLSARIAKNESDRQVAFQAAEAALRDAELDIKNLRADGVTTCSPAITGCRAERINRGDNFVTTCTAGLCNSLTFTTPVWENTTTWTAAGGSVAYGSYTGAAALPVVSQQPRYVLEYFPLGESTVYRATAVGYGADGSSQVMLQSAVKALPS